MAKPKVVKLQSSKLLDQTQLLVSDIELKNLNLALKGSASVSIVESVLDGEVTRTIEGASTVTFSLLDRDREILRSGRLTKNVDIKLDGLWFRLRGVEKRGDILTVTFEDREVALLRKYNKQLLMARKKISRSRFIKRMVDEVKEVKIKFVCPEIDKLPQVSKIFAQTAEGEERYARNPGFAPWTQPGGGKGFQGDLTVKGSPATAIQLDNTDRVLKVGANLGAPWTVMVAAVETINVESSASNLQGGDRDSVGIFQQRPSQGWGTVEQCTNIEYAANQFFPRAIAFYKKYPAALPGVIAQGVQISAYPDRYEQLREEAERTVSRWGVALGASNSGLDAKSNIEQRRAEEAANNQAASNQDQAINVSAGLGAEDFEELLEDSKNYQFSRGTMSIVDGQKKLKPENSWECSGRLAEEINWRRFMVSGTFYLMSEGYLFRSKPVMKIHEGTPGVVSIDGGYVIGTKNATCEVTASLGRWEAPPGSMIEIYGVGLISGRWLVAEIRRNLFDTTAQITLKKPRPVLPEPNLDQEKGLTFTINAPGESAHEGSVDGSDTVYVPAEAGEALSQLRELVNAGKITFDHPNDRAGLMLSSSVKRMDGTLVPINPQAIRFMAWAGERFGIRVSSLVGTHSQYVAGSNNTRQSKHWTGSGIDIGSVSGVRVDALSSKSAVMEFMRAVNHFQFGGMFGAILPNQMICNGAGKFDPEVQALQLDGGKPKGGTWVGDHIDHVHIGY